jgi:hypothetical protein
MGFLTVTMGLDVDPQFEAALGAFLGTMFTGLYYLIVRIVEMKFPQVGILLGWAKSPDSYSKGPGVDITKPAGSPDVTVNISQENTTPEDAQRQAEVYVNRTTDGPDHRI